MTDPLSDLLSAAEYGSVSPAPRPPGSDPVDAAWRASAWPRQMLRIWAVLRGPEIACATLEPEVAAFERDFDAVWAARVEAQARAIEPQFDPASVPADRALIHSARVLLGRRRADDAGLAMGNLSRACRALLADALRVHVPPPGTFDELDAIYRAKAEAVRAAATAQEAEARAKMAAAEAAPFLRSPGPFRSIAQSFEARYGVAFALHVPEEVRVITKTTIDGVAWDQLVATSYGEGAVPPAARAMGHVTCGFWGHGVNSNYFEYVCRLPHFTVWLTLHTGGAYSDNAARADSVRTYVRWLGVVAEEVRERDVDCEIFFHELSMSDDGRCKLRAADGATFEQAPRSDAARAAALAFLRARPRRRA